MLYRIILCGLLLFSGCSQTTLSGSGGGNKSGVKKNVSGDDGQTDQDIDTDSDSDSKKSADLESDIDSGGKKKSSDDDIELCNSTNGRVNIVYVIDNTGSMSSGDVMQVRAGGNSLLEMINGLSGDKKPQFHVSVVGFGNGSQPMPNGWVRMGESDSLTKARSDLEKAADPGNRGGDSIPDVGLQDAINLFDKIPTDRKKQNHRNFVVLFTDYGIETDANEQALPVKAKALAEETGAAILVVGLGDIDQDEVALWDSIGLPKSGIVAKKHVGKHLRTGNASELSGLFQGLEKDLTQDCE